MLIRRPHAAGSFYPSDPHELQQFCESLLTPEIPISARAVILPHAGFVYSGITAGKVISRIQIPRRIFLMGPNHRNYGEDFALFSYGEWESPLGKVPVDSGIARRILQACPEIRADEEAHLFEHSLEVIVPFLQMKGESFRIVPLIVGSVPFNAGRQVALSLGRFLIEQKDPMLFVVSNDMSHYDCDADTRRKDQYALKAIQNLDEDALLLAAKQHRVTMCGLLPVYMLLVMKEALRIRKATLVDYRTSADATGEPERVVGYAGFIFE